MRSQMHACNYCKVCNIVSPSCGRPTAGELDLKLRDLVRWERVALQLPQIRQSHIDIIKQNNPLDTEMQKLALYAKWLALDQTASWENVVNALASVDENTIAHNIRSEFNIILSVPPHG